MAPELMSVLLQQLKTVLAKQSNKERFRKLMLSKKATKEKAAPVRSLRLPTASQAPELPRRKSLELRHLHIQMKKTPAPEY